MTHGERITLIIVAVTLGCCVGTMAGPAKTPTAPPRSRAERAQPRAAPSTPTSGYDVPYSVSADLPYTSSIKDAVGRTITVSGVTHVIFSGVNHIEIAEAPPPPPPPPGIVFGNVTETLGAVVTAKPSGWGLILHGSGFPTTGTLRLQVAGRIAPATTIVWRSTSVEFTVPPGPASATGPVTGVFEIFEQVNGVWKLLGRGGAFTILPTPVIAAPRVGKTRR